MDLRYPIGEFSSDRTGDSDRREEFIATIENLPSKLAAAVQGLDDNQLDTEYRPDGWTVRQVVHHVADSHLNSFCRFKLALTEENPTIRAYDEGLWAELADSKLPLSASLMIIDGVHRRWSELLNNMDDADFARTLDHPESGSWTIEGFLGLYHWHSLHHTAHITELRKRKNW